MFRLLLFVKAPRPGFVKTRLAAELGPDAACAAYCVVVSALLEQLQAETAVDLLFTPDSAALELEPWRRPGWSLHPQGDGDLGERLVRAGREAFARGVTGLAIIGSDCP